MPLVMGIWRCYSGQERTDVHVTNALVPTPLGVDIWRCCSRRGPTDVHDTKTISGEQKQAPTNFKARNNEWENLQANA